MIQADPHVKSLSGALPLAVALAVGGCSPFDTAPATCMQDRECPVAHECNNGRCEAIDGACQTVADCEVGHDCTNNRCVLRVDSANVPDDEDDPNMYTCECTCSGPGQGAKGFKVPLDACMPPDINPNRGGDPSVTNIQNDCSGRIKDTVEAMSRACVSKNVTCECNADPVKQYFRDECNTDCVGELLANDCSNWDPTGGVKTANRTADTQPVCLAQGSDPPAPIPDPLAAFLAGRNSLCQVAGPTEVSIDGEDPEEQPQANGRVSISGAPCPAGQGCDVGVAYQTSIGKIEFGGFLDLFGGTTIDQLSAGGASLPGIVSLGADGKGLVHIAGMRSSGRGRNDEDEDQGMWSQNAAPLHVEIDWGSSPTCRLHGAVLGAVGDDAEVSLAVDLAGPILNRPPTANAGSDQVVECASPEGTPVNLDGTGSTDPDSKPGDDDLAVYQWRGDTRGGEELGDAEAKVSTDQALGEREYHLKVVDAGFQAHEDSVKVTVQDTTPPEVLCNAPATIVPSDVPIVFTATATDTCSGPRAVEISGFECFTATKKGKIIDKGSSCVVAFDGDTLTIHDSGGVGTTIAWGAKASDGVGQTTEVQCAVTVVKK